MSPLGRYPKKPVRLEGARLFVSDAIGFSVVVTNVQERHGIKGELYSEQEFLTLEEIRFFACVMLSLRPDRGKLCVYPIPAELIRIRDIDDQQQLIKVAISRAKAIEREGFVACRAAAPPVAGGPAYEMHDCDLDENLLSSLVRAVSLEDHVLLRGLGALVKANMLWQHSQFAEPATMMLFVAMEASFQLVRRNLQAAGIREPTATDAGNLVADTFGTFGRQGPYFAEFYESRVKAFHPSNRYGVFPFPPLQADDFYELRDALNVLYVFLIAGRKWNDLWQPDEEQA